jgi:hypothetical protein
LLLVERHAGTARKGSGEGRPGGRVLRRGVSPYRRLSGGGRTGQGSRGGLFLSRTTGYSGNLGICRE